ncbi:Serine/threonine-protein kinase [Trapelia coarctata]|nr:Serine/threonine-protein kinase [Trapelia coarctata]
MAAAMPGPSASRRSRESVQADVDIGSFTKKEEIGRGSFATVYKAKHSKSGSYVAIKSVNLSKLNKKLKDNLFSEIHILKELHHPHIVSLLDCQESSTHIHLVMEYCVIGDLSLFIKKRNYHASSPYTVDMVRKYPNPPAGGLHEVVVRHFLQQLASALEFLRNKNLIHRDVKPQNLLLIPSPVFLANAGPEVKPFVPSDDLLVPVVGLESLPLLKLADFGFARSLPSTSLAETLCGSPLYMAPEILRYEKYDAKADLWSVGTVTYEMMTGKPPFRAANHVELLRKIERGEDKIRFPEEVVISDNMKKLIRGLLRRNPVERMGFSDFFGHPVMKDTIPGLIGEDRPKQRAEKLSDSPARRTNASHDQSAQTSDSPIKRDDNPPRSSTTRTRSNRSDIPSTRQDGDNHIRTRVAQRRAASTEPETNDIFVEASEHPSHERRPALPRGITASAPRSSQNELAQKVSAAGLQRKPSRESTPSSSIPRESNQARMTSHRRSEDLRQAREAQERAAQDVAFERDYVVVEKRAVEVNALADELAASPTIHGGNHALNRPDNGAMVRRATTQATPHSTKGTHVTSTRALQIASGQRPEHRRQVSYERRLRSATSTSSAISKAINMASGRLFNFSMSPPSGLGRGPSPPLYSPFPAYPATHGSLLMLEDGSKASTPLDEDSKAVRVIEESATRSDVVYGFAEVKYKQLIPIAPSMQHGLELHGAGIPEKDGSGTATEEDSGLTPDAIVTLSEEALVLYVKALSLLARSMDIAGAWWARKSRGEIVEESTSPKNQATPAQNPAVGNRVNNVVQWVRSRFNEVLEKAEFVRRKLIEAQKLLPLDHPSHPNNHPSSMNSTSGMGTSSDNVVVSPGVSAEKLMYLRAVEMSRSAAVNELVCDDLPGCEIAYVTAIRMLEAVLMDEDDDVSRKITTSEKDSSGGKSEEPDFSLVNPEDRDAVVKMVASIRSRLTALRKKLHIMAKRQSAPAAAATAAHTTKPTIKTSVPSNPVLAGTPPR